MVTAFFASVRVIKGNEFGKYRAICGNIGKYVVFQYVTTTSFLWHLSNNLYLCIGFERNPLIDILEQPTTQTHYIIMIDIIPSSQKEDDARISSLEIAEMAGKQHKNVMRDIREMEDAWVKVHGLRFELMQKKVATNNGGYRTIPCYSLSKLESLYVITKYSNEARAKLVLRWYELEKEAKAVREAKADYYDEVMESIDSFTVRKIAAQLKMTAQELNRLLCEEHVQYGQSGSYLPYAEFARQGFCKSRTYKRHDAKGAVRTEHRTTWTETGITFIVQKVREVKARRIAMMKPRYVQLTFVF